MPGARGAPARAPGRRPRRIPDPATLDGARRAGPRRGAPAAQLATLVAHVPTGDAWLHETKWDGYRILADVRPPQVRLWSRNGLDWTDRLGTLASSLASLPAPALLDGEVVALDAHGVSSFQALQNAIGGGGALHYQVFDLLELNGWDVRAAPLVQRKQALQQLLAVARRPDVRFSDHVAGQGEAFFAQACAHGLEGVVSKQANAPYRPGRGGTWLKTKCLARQEFVIGGWTEPRGARSGLGALLVGVHEGGSLRYAGRVGTGFDTRTLTELTRRLRKLERARSPFDPAPRGLGSRGAHWAEPTLVAEVAFTEWTGDGRLRHPSFQGLREDKRARDVVRERPAAGGASPHRNGSRAASAAPARSAPRTARSAAPASRTGRAAPASASRATRSTILAHVASGTPARDRDETPVEVAGVSITHPSRVIDPASGLTKLALARYAAAAGPRLLEHLAGRPMMVARCQQGLAGPCYWQKHARGGLPAPIKSVIVPERTGRAPYLAVDDVAGIVTLVQLGAMEFHVWGARVDAIERPDRVVFDLDPDAGVPWARVVEAALALRKRLAALDLDAFVKTTGGKGLHVEVPIARRHGWDEVKAFSSGLAQELVRDDPERYVATLSKARRHGRILIDWLRNGRGATWVAAWSPRRRAQLPVAMPLRWRELFATRDAVHWTIAHAAARAARDPWDGMQRLPQRLPKRAVPRGPGRARR